MAKPDPTFEKSQAADDNPRNDTMPFNGKDKQEGTEDGAKLLDEAAEKAVADQHGRNAKKNPNYDELVNDAKDQIKDAVDKNKDM